VHKCTIYLLSFHKKTGQDRWLKRRVNNNFYSCLLDGASIALHKVVNSIASTSELFFLPLILHLHTVAPPEGLPPPHVAHIGVGYGKDEMQQQRKQSEIDQDLLKGSCGGVLGLGARRGSSRSQAWKTSFWRAVASECYKALVESIVWLTARLFDEQTASKPAWLLPRKRTGSQE